VAPRLIGAADRIAQIVTAKPQRNRVSELTFLRNFFVSFSKKGLYSFVYI